MLEDCFDKVKIGLYDFFYPPFVKELFQVFGNYIFLALKIAVKRGSANARFFADFTYLDRAEILFFHKLQQSGCYMLNYIEVAPLVTVR